MKKFLAIMGLLAIVTFLLVGPTAAQDGPTLTVDPDTVEAAGEADLTVTGSGFSAGIDLFVLSCIAPDGDIMAINGQEDCDVQNLTPVTADDDGNFEVDVTFDIVENFAVLAGDSAQTESAGALVQISGGGGDDGGEDEATTTTAPPETTTTTEAPTDDDTAEDESADMVDGEMPETGSESSFIIGGALALAAAGVLATRGGQLLGRR